MKTNKRLLKQQEKSGDQGIFGEQSAECLKPFVLWKGLGMESIMFGAKGWKRNLADFGKKYLFCPEVITKPLRDAQIIEELRREKEIDEYSNEELKQVRVSFPLKDTRLWAEKMNSFVISPFPGESTYALRKAEIRDGEISNSEFFGDILVFSARNDSAVRVSSDGRMYFCQSGAVKVQ